MALTGGLLSQDAGDTFVYLAQAAGAFIEGCTDKVGIAKSVTLGTGVTDLLVGTNYFRNQNDVGKNVTATIASGVLAVSRSDVTRVVVNGEGAVADQLDSITGGIIGQVVTFSPGNATITFADSAATPGLRLASNFVANNGADAITLIKTAADVWIEVARSDNA